MNHDVLNGSAGASAPPARSRAANEAAAWRTGSVKRASQALGRESKAERDRQ